MLLRFLLFGGWGVKFGMIKPNWYNLLLKVPNCQPKRTKWPKIWGSKRGKIISRAR
jgi:hypothetical protein